MNILQNKLKAGRKMKRFKIKVSVELEPINFGFYIKAKSFNTAKKEAESIAMTKLFDLSVGFKIKKISSEKQMEEII